MKDIRVYDFEFNLLYVLCDIISCSWHILYNGIGTFEGKFSTNDDIINVFMNNKYLVIVQGDYQAICTGKIVDNKLTVCGRTVNWILSKRVRPPFKTDSIFGNSFTNPENVLFYCLRKGFTEPCIIDQNGNEISGMVDNNKKVSNFILPTATNPPNMTSHFWRTSAHPISELCVDLCEKMNRGHRVVYDIVNRQWVFQFIIPEENSTFIANDTKTCHDMEYTEDILSYTDGGWYTSSDADDGMDDVDVDKWHYINNSGNTGIYFWDSVFGICSNNEAKEKLDKKQRISKITAKFKNLKYGTDYFLGNIFCVYVRVGKFTKQEKYMVTGVDIKISTSQNYEEPILEQVNEGEFNE